jgi:hypothetical protein
MEDKCKACGGPLFIGPTTFKSDVGTNVVKAVQTQYCPCATCTMFKVTACRKESDVPQEVE